MNQFLRFAAPLALVAAGMGAAVLPASPAHAQDKSVEARLKQVEAELRAVQRKVFPDGAGRVLAPEITAPASSLPAPGVSAPSTMADTLARLDTIEAQIRRLTLQAEEAQNRAGKMEARLAALEARATPDEPATGTAMAAEPAAAAPAAAKPAPAPTAAAKPATPKPAPTPAAKPPASRVAAVQAIVKPQTGDAGEDEYQYGFALWEARFYPEAQQQLQKVVDGYPKHKRISYARNLLGRAYLDDGKPGTAAQWFVQNYTTDKQGARAPDSLLYLAQAMVSLKQTMRACVALKELGTNYPAESAGRLKQPAARIRASVTCN